MPFSTDDWMHPRPMPRFEYKERDPMEKPFLIVREKRIICSFSGGRAPTEWKEWACFAIEEERDAEFERLQSTTSWSLRTAKMQHRALGGGWDFDDYGPAYAMKMMRREKTKQKA